MAKPSAPSKKPSATGAKNGVAPVSKRQESSESSDSSDSSSDDEPVSVVNCWPSQFG